MSEKLDEEVSEVVEAVEDELQLAALSKGKSCRIETENGSRGKSRRYRERPCEMKRNRNLLRRNRSKIHLRSTKRGKQVEVERAEGMVS